MKANDKCRTFERFSQLWSGWLRAAETDARLLNGTRAELLCAFTTKVDRDEMEFGLGMFSARGAVGVALGRPWI